MDSDIPAHLNIISTSSIWQSPRASVYGAVGRVSHIFNVTVDSDSLRSSHLKIWTLFLLAVLWRWEGFLGGSDAFFALFRVIPELSASFWSPRWRRVLCHRGFPCQLELWCRGYTRIHSGFRTTTTTIIQSGEAPF